jgi:hypothetical protein
VTVVDELAPFIGALNLDRLRLGAPRRFIFFCGGKIDKTKSRPPSLRDYLLRELKGRNAVDGAEFVCAETATQLFRDSGYGDLIAFEEDIAHLSDIILVIGESAGSLTELGAFSMNETISRRLKIIVRDDYYNQESFIRHGPLRHMEQKYSDSVSSYPWRVYSDDSGIIKSTAAPHITNIRQELVDRLSTVSATEAFLLSNRRHTMILIYWILHVLRAAIIKEIVEALDRFGIKENQDSVKRYLYCMRVAEWIGEKKYGHPTYYYPRIDRDPLEYAFNDVKIRDHTRWKSIIAERLTSRALRRPKVVLELVGS